MTSTVTIDGLEFTRYVQAFDQGRGLVIHDPHRVGES
jgi:hypothetical protein